MLNYTNPKGVGYWGKASGQGLSALPCPQNLVRAAWRLEDRDRIVAYLQGGHIWSASPVLAYCRFMGCATVLASCDLTDGEWLWPQRLEHYVVEHGVCLPEALVPTMQANHWQAPSEVNGDEILTQLARAKALPYGDLSHWIR